MYTILLPVDEQVERAEAQASFLVDGPFDVEAVRCIVAHAYLDQYGDPQEGRPKAVTAAIEALEAAGFDVEFAEINSPPSSQINAFAVDEGVDQIVMCGRKRSPTAKAVFGSVTQSVLLDTDIPVTVLMHEE